MMASFWLTSMCNMKCVYCYEGEQKKHEYMSEEIVDKAIFMIIKKMKEENDNYLCVIIHGGEPFLAFDKMKYLVDKMKIVTKQNDIKVSFGCTTNATLLTDESIEFIKNEIYDFTISMDGNKETQNYSRPFSNGEGTFNIVEKRVKEILKIKPELRIRMTYNHHTVAKLYENVKYMVDLGVENIVPARDFFDKNFTEDHIKILEEQIKKIHMSFSDKEDLLNNWKLRRLGICSGGISSYHIDAKGLIYPCMLTVGNDEFIIGDIENGINRKKRDQLLSYSEQDNVECLGCVLHQYCNETRCKMTNKIINGGYCSPSPISCAEMSIKYRLIV